MDNSNQDRDFAPEVYPRSKHCVSRKNIDPDALKILWRLIRNGHKAYLVGGGVRDLLLQKKPKDFDIATDATPRQIKALFRNCRIIGRRFKLAHIFFGGNKIIEVSTFRAKVDFNDADAPTSPEDMLITRDNTYGNEVTDALRRDLTINALFYDLSTFSIIDYVGGMRDLQLGVARIIGDPLNRFGEDPVRMLRLVRYAIKSGLQIEPVCQSALRQMNALIVKSASARLYEELKKDFCSGYAKPILRAYAEYNLLDHLIPEISASSCSILAEKSDLALALGVADELSTEGSENVFTAVLCLLALFGDTGTVLQPDLIARFDSIPMLHSFIDQTFRKIPIPRKEREKIETILEFWFELEKNPLERVRRARMVHSSVFDDLVNLIHCLNFDGTKSAKLAFLKEGPEKFPGRHRERTAVRRKDHRRGPGRLQRGAH